MAGRVLGRDHGRRHEAGQGVSRRRAGVSMKVALPVYAIHVIDGVLWVGIKDVPKEADHFEVIATLNPKSRRRTP